MPEGWQQAAEAAAAEAAARAAELELAPPPPAIAPPDPIPAADGSGGDVAPAGQLADGHAAPEHVAPLSLVKDEWVQVLCSFRFPLIIRCQLSVTCANLLIVHEHRLQLLGSFLCSSADTAAIQESGKEGVSLATSQLPRSCRLELTV